LKLVKENQRINTSLFNNDKINRTALIRSDNEVTKINAQLETAKLEKIMQKIISILSLIDRLKMILV